MANRYHPVTSVTQSKTGGAAHSAVPAPRPSGAGKPLPFGYLAALLTVLCAVGLALGTPLKVGAQTAAPPQPTRITQYQSGGGTGLGKNQYVVFWDTPQVAGKLATAYELEYKRNTTEIWTSLYPNIPPVASARTTVHHTHSSAAPLLDSACYMYRVRAKNSAGESAWAETPNCKTSFTSSAIGVYNAPERPTVQAVAGSGNEKFRISIKRPIPGSDSRTYQLQRRPADCSTTAYTLIRQLNSTADPFTALTLTNDAGTGSGTGVVAGVDNAEPAGVHLYRARIPGPTTRGSWSLPVAVRTNSDGTKEYINHVASASEEKRHNVDAGTCVVVP